jgi:oxaloacetate decarboxylase alpha subunit
MTTTVDLVDTTLRDGNQSLWGAMGMTTPDVLGIAPVLDRAGFRAIDFTSSTHMGISVRFHKEDPFERIRLTRAAMPNTPLSFITTGMRFITWDRSPESVMRLSLRLVARHGIRRLQISEPMNDTAATLQVARMAKESGIDDVVPALVYTLSPFHNDAFYVERAATLAASPDISRLYVKDPGGLLTPERVRSLLPQILEAAAGTEVELHSHCTTSLAPVCYVEAARLGIATLHTAVGPLANGTSQPSAERTVANLAELGVDAGVDLDAVAEVAAYFREMAARKDLVPGVPVEYDLSYYRHQIPGGMMTTLSRQLGEIGEESRFGEVLEEAVRVRAELGFPIMVTPFSQYVGAQAVFNVTSKRGRYATIPDGVVAYVLGEYGTPPGPVSDEVRERALDSKRARALREPRPEPTLEDLRRIHGATLSDEELVLRAVLPGAQVDAALAGSSPAA